MIDNRAERQLLEKIPVSAAPDIQYFNLKPLGKSLRGLSILDVGAGFSEFTAEMLRRGADAYAVDPVYQTKGIVNEFLQARIEMIRDGDSATRACAAMEHRAATRFRRSFIDDPARYVEAVASSLPFPDGSFDYVFSCNSVVGYVDAELEIFQSAIDEITRVTKAQGEIFLGPIWGDGTLDSEVQQGNRQFVKERLKNKGYIYSEIPAATFPDVRVVTIVKAKS